MTELTTEQFLNNQDYVDTLFDYADRQGKIVTSKQEALENFLSDYRGVQANTALALMFKNDIDAIEDQEDKAALGRLYKAVDEDLEDFAGEQSGLETVAEYAGKAILDPINIFGLGVGKAVATAAGRPLLKKFISDAFVKRPITTGVVSGAAIEAPLGAVSAAAVESVKGPDGFGIQEEIEAKDLALPAAISGLAGGLFGGIGAKLGKSATKNIQSIIDQAEAATQQGQAAKFTNMKDFIDDQTPSVTGVDKQADTIGVYVSSDTITPDADNYAQFGRIIDVEGDMAKVEFLPTTYANEKNPTTDLYDDRKVLDISVDKLKPLSVKKKDESLKEYVKENGLFFDKAGIERGKKFLKGEGESDEEVTRLFDQTLTEEMFDDVTRFVVDAGLFIKEAQPNSKAAKQIEITLDDPTKRITEKAASLLELSKENPDLLPESIARAMKKNGLTEANIKDIVKAETSIAASKLATQSEIQRLLKGESILGRKLDRALEKLTDTQLAQLKALEKEREIEKAIATKFGLSVDIWRSLLVTQPATVLRNVFGSVMRVPGQTLDTFLDEFFIGWESNALGIDAPKIPMRKDALGLTKNLLNPFESVELARIVAKNFDEADKKLFRVFDDYFSTDVQAKVGAGPVLKSLHKYSLAANVLSRMQDRAIKSAGFMAELDNQVKQGINRGDIVDDNVTGIIDLIKQNKLNLLNDDMVSKSLSTAYNLTYQNRRAGDDVVFFGAGRLINTIQEKVNQSSAIKALIPFPNFIANMIAYNINRLGGGLVKSIAGGTRLLNKKATGGKGLAKKQRQRINEIKEELNSLKTMSLQERKKLLKAKGKDHIKKEINKLSNEFDDLNRQAGDRLQDISDIRSGIVQTIEGGALLSMAIAIREEIGGERYNTIKAKGQTVDLSPLFPLTPFLFGAEMYIRLRDGLPFDDSHITEGIQAFTGLQVDRAGPLPKFIQNFARSSQTIFSSEDPEQLKQIGKLVGTTVGHYLKGYLTPFKAPGDLAKTLGSEERRISYERDFQSLETELGDKGIPMGYVLDGAIDEFAKQLFRGTYLEKEVFGEEDTYRYIPPTARKQEQQFLPVAKQFTGMGAAKVIDDVESELLRLDIPSYKFVPASSVPEYKDVYKQELSELSEDIVKPFVNSEYYKSLPYEQKKAELRSFYYGGKGDMDKKQREMVERTGGAAANLREQVSLKIKNEKPLLLQLHNFRKSHKKSEIGRLYRRMKQLDQSIPPLKYIGEETDEKGENKQAKKQSELITLLSSILEDPAKNNSAYITNELRRLGRPVYNKGGYVSQMNALGL